MKTRLSGLTVFSLMSCVKLQAQTQEKMPLTLNQAITIWVQHHELLKAKTNYANASLEGYELILSYYVLFHFLDQF